MTKSSRSSYQTISCLEENQLLKKHGPKRFKETVALSVGVLAMVFLISYVVLAWTPPTASLPDENVPAPINVGPLLRLKKGPLNIDTTGWDKSFTVKNNDYYFLPELTEEMEIM